MDGIMPSYPPLARGSRVNLIHVIARHTSHSDIVARSCTLSSFDSFRNAQPLDLSSSIIPLPDEYERKEDMGTASQGHVVFGRETRHEAHRCWHRMRCSVF